MLKNRLLLLAGLTVLFQTSSHAFIRMGDSVSVDDVWRPVTSFQMNPSNRSFTYYVSDQFYNGRSGQLETLTTLHTLLVQKAVEIFAARSGFSDLSFTYGGTYTAASMSDVLTGISNNAFLKEDVTDDRFDQKIYFDFTASEYSATTPLAQGIAVRSSSSDTYAAGGVVLLNGRGTDLIHPGYSLVKLLLHELLHVFGLGHSTVASSFLSLNDLYYFNLSEDDRLGLQQVLNSTTTNSITVNTLLNGSAAPGVEVALIDTTTARSYIFGTSSEGTATINHVPNGTYWLVGREYPEATAGPCFQNKTTGILSSFYVNDSSSTNTISSAGTLTLSSTTATYSLNLIAGTKQFDCYAGTPIVTQVGTRKKTDRTDLDSGEYYMRPGMIANLAITNDLFLHNQGATSKTTDTNKSSGVHSSVTVSSVGSAPHLNMVEFVGAANLGSGDATGYHVKFQSMPDAATGTYAALCSANGEQAIISGVVEVSEFGGSAINVEYIPEHRDGFDYDNDSFVISSTTDDTSSCVSLFTSGPGGPWRGLGEISLLALLALIASQLNWRRRRVFARYGAVTLAGVLVMQCGSDSDPTTSASQLIQADSPLSTGAWTKTSTINAPVGRENHTAVWSGSEMLIWGGSGTVYGYLSDGAKYNPDTDTWTAMASTVLGARAGHTAVWTGSVMVVWGGRNESGALGDGAMYDPSADTWTAMSGTSAPSARVGHTAVWTGSKMIIWGGRGDGSAKSDGAVFDPSNNTWASMTATSAPSARFFHGAAWTGSQMMVWGGDSGTAPLATGALYNLSGDSWTTVSTTDAPSARWGHSMASDGSSVVVVSGATAEDFTNTGAIYNVSGNSWTATSTDSAPSATVFQSSVWTGTEMIVWGGAGTVLPVNGGSSLNVGNNTWSNTNLFEQGLYTRKSHTAVWTGTKMIVWGGAGSFWLVDRETRHDGGGVYTPQ